MTHIDVHAEVKLVIRKENQILGKLVILHVVLAMVDPQIEMGFFNFWKKGLETLGLLNI